MNKSLERRIDKAAKVTEKIVDKKRTRFKTNKGYSILEAKFYVRFNEPHFYVKYICHKTQARKTYDGPVNQVQENLGTEVNDFLTGLVVATEELGGE